MNKYVKTLIKKYKNPSIIGEKSIEEVWLGISNFYDYHTDVIPGLLQ